MATENVTIVSRKGDFSIHASFKKACLAYGWNYEQYKGRVQNQIDDYLIHKIPLEVTIDCLQLMEIMTRNEAVIKSEKNEDGLYVVTISTINHEYKIVCDYETIHEPANYVQTDRGREMEYAAYDYDELTEVQMAFKIDEDGNGEAIELDDYTNDFILNYIEI